MLVCKRKALRWFFSLVIFCQTRAWDLLGGQFLIQFLDPDNLFSFEKLWYSEKDVWSAKSKVILICSQPKNGTVLKELKVRNSRRNKVLKSQTVIYYGETYFLSLRTGSLSLRGFSNPLKNISSPHVTWVKRKVAL